MKNVHRRYLEVHLDRSQEDIEPKYQNLLDRAEEELDKILTRYHASIANLDKLAQKSTISEVEKAFDEVDQQYAELAGKQRTYFCELSLSTSLDKRK